MDLPYLKIKGRSLLPVIQGGMDKLLWGDSGLRDAADNIILDSHQMIVTGNKSGNISSIFRLVGSSMA